MGRNYFGYERVKSGKNGTEITERESEKSDHKDIIGFKGGAI